MVKSMKNENNLEFNDLANEFKNFLLIDKKYSNETINSYMNDLNKYYLYIKNNNLNINNMTRKDIINYTKYLKSCHLSSSSISHNISVLKSFYKFLIVTKNFKTNLMDIVDTPKKGITLPKVLSIEEVDKLLDIDFTNKYSYRNKAMLEVMYATGLRVSELVNLKLNQIDFDSDLIRVMGKGSKERIVPVGEIAMRYLKIYINEFYHLSYFFTI